MLPSTSLLSKETHAEVHRQAPRVRRDGKTPHKPTAAVAVVIILVSTKECHGVMARLFRSFASHSCGEELGVVLNQAVRGQIKSKGSSPAH